MNLLGGAYGARHRESLLELEQCKYCDPNLGVVKGLQAKQVTYVEGFPE